MTENPREHRTTRLPLRRVVGLSVVLLLGLAAGGAAIHPVTRAGLETIPRSLEGLPGTLEEVRGVALRELEEVRGAALRELEGWVDQFDPGEGVVLSLPAPDHPPVLLVPGWSDRATELEDFRSRLVEAGWDPSRVVALDFRDPVGSNLSHAEEVAAAVDRLRGETGAAKVDIVAFSMGGLAVRHYLLSGGGETSIRKAAFMATPHRGTAVAIFAWGEGGREMIPGSSFLERLNRDGIPEGVEMAAFRTPVDTRVVPHTSAVLPGAANVEICCPGHSEMLRDEETFVRVADFLLRVPGPSPPQVEGDSTGPTPPTPLPGAAEGVPAQGLDPIRDHR